MDGDLEPMGRDVTCEPNSHHVPQNPLHPPPLRAGPRAGAAALETARRLLGEFPLEPPRTGRCAARSSREMETRETRGTCPRCARQPGPRRPHCGRSLGALGQRVDKGDGDGWWRETERERSVSLSVEEKDISPFAVTRTELEGSC